MNANNPAAVWPFPTGSRPGAITLPPLGQLWLEQGGIFAGLIKRADGGADALIVAAGNDAQFAIEIAWGEYGTDLPGATDTNHGHANTQAMAEAGNAAAQWALSLQLGGHADWYIPAQDELALAYINAREEFPKEWHWSSTQYSAHGAWGQHFANGTQDTWYKGSKLRARAVRRFSVIV